MNDLNISYTEPRYGQPLEMEYVSSSIHIQTDYSNLF